MSNVQKELEIADARIRELEDEVFQLRQKWASPAEVQDIKTYAWLQGHTAGKLGIAISENPYG